jgi:hypothetical protein
VLLVPCVRKVRAVWRKGRCLRISHWANLEPAVLQLWARGEGADTSQTLAFVKGFRQGETADPGKQRESLLLARLHGSSPGQFCPQKAFLVPPWWWAGARLQMRNWLTELEVEWWWGLGGGVMWATRHLIPSPPLPIFLCPNDTTIQGSHQIHVLSLPSSSTPIFPTLSLTPFLSTCHCKYFGLANSLPWGIQRSWDL